LVVLLVVANFVVRVLVVGRALRRSDGADVDVDDLMLSVTMTELVLKTGVLEN
jgi:hypothetical protein